MSNEKDYRLYDDNPAFLEGYWDAMGEGHYDNPYVEMSPDWCSYELGWEGGWLDS